MSVESIRTVLECVPLLIDPLRVAGLFRALEGVKAGVWDEIDKDLEGRAKRPQISIIDGVAVVPVHGVLVPETDAIDRIMGYVATSDVQRMVSEAVESKARGILLDINSPGGAVTGVEETGDMIADARKSKPVMAYAGELAASGAMWLASQATGFYAGKSATVGSIGVYMAFADRSKMAEMMGIKVDVIKSSETPYKAAGVPGTSLSDAQRGQFQSQVDYIFQGFKAAIMRGRPKVKAEAMQGQTFTGAQAKDVGLVDSVASFAQALTATKNLADLRGMKG